MLSFPSSEREKVRPAIVRFLENNPEAARRYSATPLYHLTHSKNVPNIMAEGLRAHPELFPAEEGEFLLAIHDRYGRGLPSDRDEIQNRILNAQNVYLSTSVPNLNGNPGYGIPERLMLLMRSLHALQSKQSLTPEEREYARAALERHKASLLDNDPAITALEVSPLAPSVLNDRLGRIAVADLDYEGLLWNAENPDGAYPNNIAITDTIDPLYIKTFGTMPLTEEFAMRGVETKGGWASSIA